MKTILKMLFYVAMTTFISACGDGNNDSGQRPVNENKPPLANINVKKASAEQITTFKFSPLDSSDSDGTITKYTWDFGDGSKSTEKSPIHTYKLSGTYMAKLTVTDNGGLSASKSQQIKIDTPAVSVVSKASEFTASLANVVTVKIPATTFVSETNIGIWSTAKPETATDFEITSQMFTSALRAQTEIRINTGMVQPSKTLSVIANVPADFEAKLLSKDELKVFVQIFQDGGDEILDNFELIEATYNNINKTLSFDLEPAMFTNRRTFDDSWEAVIVVGSTSTKPAAAVPLNAKISALKTSAEAEKVLAWPSIAMPETSFFKSSIVSSSSLSSSCEGATLRSPLEHIVVTGEYNPPKHYGTDYRAASGTEVSAMASGTVDKIGFDERPLAEPDPRSGKTVKGWGNYIVIKHEDGSKSLYAHLQTGDIKVKAGQKISAGDPIALSDNSGGSEAPHLHVEYAPNGEIFKKGSKVNPNACIGSNVDGSIQVSDNGTAADDAFSISFNGKAICSTTIGATNNCALGALRSGTATLTITATIAPDNIGTYEIALSGGIKFSDASTKVSGTLAQGGSASFTIVIP